MAIDDEITNRRFKKVTGSERSFETIDGIGPATAQKIKNADFSINTPADVADMSADELSDKAGISYSRAEKAIRGGGGNPNQSKRSSTGSVSAAGITMPVGDFRVEAGDQDRARYRNDTMSRSEEAVRMDEQKRAPITTDVDKWRKNKSRYDYPGVDTPTQDPKALPKDYKKGGPFRTTTPSPASQAKRGRKQPSPERNTDAPESESTGLLNQDVSLAPEEAFEGTAAVSPNALGGNDEVRGGERAPRNELREPPELGKKRQKFGASKYLDEQDNSPKTIAEYYESGDIDVGLGEFAQRVRRKKRKSEIPLDMYAASDKVGKELGAFPAYRD